MDSMVWDRVTPGSPNLDLSVIRGEVEAVSPTLANADLWGAWLAAQARSVKVDSVPRFQSSIDADLAAMGSWRRSAVRVDCPVGFTDESAFQIVIPGNPGLSEAYWGATVFDPPPPSDRSWTQVDDTIPPDLYYDPVDGFVKNGDGSTAQSYGYNEFNSIYQIDTPYDAQFPGGYQYYSAAVPGTPDTTEGRVQKYSVPLSIYPAVAVGSPYDAGGATGQPYRASVSSLTGTASVALGELLWVGASLGSPYGYAKEMVVSTSGAIAAGGDMLWDVRDGAGVITSEFSDGGMRYAPVYSNAVGPLIHAGVAAGGAYPNAERHTYDGSRWVEGYQAIDASLPYGTSGIAMHARTSLALRDAGWFADDSCSMSYNGTEYSWSAFNLGSYALPSFTSPFCPRVVPIRLWLGSDDSSPVWQRWFTLKQSPVGFGSPRVLYGYVSDIGSPASDTLPKVAGVDYEFDGDGGAMHVWLPEGLTGKISIELRWSINRDPGAPTYLSAIQTFGDLFDTDFNLSRNGYYDYGIRMYGGGSGTGYFSGFIGLKTDNPHTPGGFYHSYMWEDYGYAGGNSWSQDFSWQNNAGGGILNSEGVYPTYRSVWICADVIRGAGSVSWLELKFWKDTPNVPVSMGIALPRYVIVHAR